MNARFTWRLILSGGLTVALGLPLSVNAQEAVAEKAPSPVVAAMTSLAEKTSVQIVDSRTKETRDARWTGRPLVRYGDETRYIQDSTLWVWMDGSLPVAFQKVEINNWVPNVPQWTYCFSSMFPKPLSVTWPDRKGAFTPEAATFLPIDGGPVPGKDKRARSSQMREMSRDFLVLSDNGNKTSELRLMPRPILEYEGTGIVAGAVFAQAEGTNPDCLIAIQLIERGGDEPGKGGQEWVFTPVRMTSHGLTLKFKDKVLWSEPNQPRSGDFKTWCYFFTPRDQNLK
jgi:hypothetical protein